MNKSVYLLSLCNAFMYVGSSMLITISALIGFQLAPMKLLSTLPTALQFLAVMLVTIPASLFMEKHGRRFGFYLACGIGLIGSCLALIALFNHNFIAYCLACLCFGAFTAFGNYFRFTAAEVVEPTKKNQAISLVMAGGLIAAFLGPNLASWSQYTLFDDPYANAFLISAFVYLLSFIAISFADLPKPEPRQTAYSGRAMLDILLQPVFIVAVLCAMLGYATMNLVMTSTPLAMSARHLLLPEISTVIQWHVVAMFAPSFFTGHLINRFGNLTILTAGVVCGLVCVGINLSGTTLAHFIAGLVMLGLSWNFLYVGGTTLLTQAYRPEEKARTQAANDFLVFTVVTLTALTAGALHFIAGWRVVNLTVIPFLLTAGLAIGWYALTRKRPVVAV